MTPPPTPQPTSGDWPPYLTDHAAKPEREETTLGRPLLWAAAWGSLGALLLAISAIITMGVMLLAFLALAAAVSDTQTIADVFDGGLGALGDLRSFPFETFLLFALPICAVLAVLSMGALVALRLHSSVRRLSPLKQGLVAAGGAYIFLSFASQLLASLAQTVLGTP